MDNEPAIEYVRQDVKSKPCIQPQKRSSKSHKGQGCVALSLYQHGPKQTWSLKTDGPVGPVRWSKRLESGSTEMSELGLRARDDGTRGHPLSHADSSALKEEEYRLLRLQERGT